MTENSTDTFSSRHVEKGHAVIHILIALFGISAWIGINGIFVQFPVLISVCPEGWKLPVYTVLVIQSANVGPLLYTLFQHLRYELKPASCILCLLVAGTFATILLVFFHAETTTIAGEEHSLALFILIFFNALVGCFSSVLFMPYLHNFSHIYMVSYFIGEGLSGVLPSVVALFQGIVDGSPCNSNNLADSWFLGLNFSSADYFIFLAVILLFSLMAFILLEYSPFVHKRRINNIDKNSETPEETKINYKSQDTLDFRPRDLYLDSTENKVKTSPRKYYVAGHHFSNNTMKRLSKKRKAYLFLLLGIACFFGNGFLLSIQSYSCLPYGGLAYKLSIILSQMANPIACCFGLWILTSNLKVINYLFLIAVIIGTYVTYLALVSPSPPWQELKLGTAIVITSWTVLIGLISYLKLVIVSLFRKTATQKMLFYVGAIMQTGSAVGAVTSFVLINFTNIFTAYDKCTFVNN